MYLVTGASGFVGRELCGKLVVKGRVRALHRHQADGPWDEAVHVDLAATDALGPALEGVDTVFHLAGKTDDSVTGSRDVGVFHRVNFEGTARLFGASVASGVKRFVFLSSVKAVGAMSEGCVDERSSDRPTTPYGLSKRAAEDLVLMGGGIPHVCVVRACPVYGAGSKGNLVRMIRAMTRGVFPPIPDTKNVRSMVHVEDLVDALILCAERGGANRRVFIVTDGRSYSTREIYGWVCETMGRRTPRWSVPAFVLRGAGKLGDACVRVTGKSLVLHSGVVERLLGSARYDSSLIERTLGYRPKWDLKKALPEMVRATERGA